MRTLPVVALVLLSFVAVPVAMAFDGCGGTGTMCAAPCSAPCGVSVITSGEPILSPVAQLLTAAPARFWSTPLKALDAPPKSLLS